MANQQDIKKQQAQAVGGAAAVGVTTAAAANAAIPVLVSAVGFGKVGVAAGSAAAAYQATFGGVIAKSSLFAALQSIGATSTIGLCLPLAIGTGVGYLSYRLIRPRL